MAQLLNLKFFLYLYWLGAGSSPLKASRRNVVFKLMKDNTQKEEYKGSIIRQASRKTAYIFMLIMVSTTSILPFLPLEIYLFLVLAPVLAISLFSYYWIWYITRYLTKLEMQVRKLSRELNIEYPYATID